MDDSFSDSVSSVGSLGSYRQALASCPRLAKEEEKSLARDFRAGDLRARDRLVRACLPFVVTIAREYRRWGVPLEDLVQQGNLGLLKAAERFDPERDCRLITYAGYWIRAEIREYVVRCYRVVRLGTTKGERRALRLYRKTRETDLDVLSAASGLSHGSLEKLLPILTAREVSVDQPNMAGITPLEKLASPGYTPEEDLAVHETRVIARTEVDAFLTELPARDRAILNARLLSENPITLEKLGQRFGISKERVRQLEERTIEKLRSRLLACTGLAEAC